MEKKSHAKANLRDTEILKHGLMFLFSSAAALLLPCKTMEHAKETLGRYEGKLEESPFLFSLSHHNCNFKPKPPSFSRSVGLGHCHQGR